MKNLITSLFLVFATIFSVASQASSLTTVICLFADDMTKAIVIDEEARKAELWVDNRPTGDSARITNMVNRGTSFVYTLYDAAEPIGKRYGYLTVSDRIEVVDGTILAASEVSYSGYKFNLICGIEL